MTKDEVMDRLDIAPPGERGSRFELCDFVRTDTRMKRQVRMTLDEIHYTLNGWVEVELDDPLMGFVVGERYVNTGRYIPDTSTPSTPLGPASYSPAELKRWRTHHVILVAHHIRKAPVYVLSDRLEEV